MILDLRKNGKLPIDLVKKLSALEPIIRKEYNKYIGELINKNKIEDVAWLIPVTCRNTYSIMVHDRLCRFSLVQHLLQNNIEIEKIIVDSIQEKSVLLRIINYYSQSIDVVSDVNSNKYMLQYFNNLVHIVYTSIILYLCSRIFPKKKSPKGIITILDTVLFKNSFDNKGHYKEHFYPSIKDKLPKDKCDSIWYAPVFYGIDSPFTYIKIFKSIANLTSPFMVWHSQNPFEQWES